MGLMGVTKGYKGLQRVTGGYRGLLRVRGYKFYSRLRVIGG